jgi:hypothetical protein
MSRFEIAGANAAEFLDAVADVHDLPQLGLSPTPTLAPGKPTKKGRAGVWPHTAFFVG